MEGKRVIKITHHAHSRISERLSLAEKEVVRLLGSRKRSVSLENFEVPEKIFRPGFRYRLFYSLADSECFLAVIDVGDNVVTIYPQEATRLKIPYGMRKRAEELARADAKRRAKPPPGQRGFVYTATVSNGYTGETTEIPIEGLKVSGLPLEVWPHTYYPRVLRRLRKRLQRKVHRQGLKLARVTVREGEGEEIRVPELEEE